MTETYRPETIVASAGVATDGAHRGVSPPLYLSATYGWRDPETKPAYDYSRSGNPTRTELELALAELEGAARGVITASGMAAVDLPLNLVSPGELVLAPHDCYGGTFRLLSAHARRGNFRVKFINQTDPDAFSATLAEKPRLVLIETPSNPLLRITDIAGVAAAAKEAGAIVVADNTFLSPVLQQPLSLGCDVVVHSTTKYISGHSDVIGGALIIAWQLFAAHPQPVVYSSVLASAYAIFYACEPNTETLVRSFRQRLEFLLKFGVMFLAGAGLAAVQLLPAAEFARQSVRQVSGLVSELPLTPRSHSSPSSTRPPTGTRLSACRRRTS